MRTKILLVVGVLTAIFAFPAVASAAEWTDAGKPLTEKKKAELSGPMGFKSALGSYECSTLMPVTLEPGSKGTIGTIEISTKECKGTSSFAGCTPTEVKITKTPFVAATILPNPKIDFEGELIIDFRLEGCALSEVTYTFKSGFQGTPDKASAISDVTLSGTGITDASGSEISTEIFGTLKMSPAGTYGIA
jgi:hypothetical protein